MSELWQGRCYFMKKIRSLDRGRINRRGGNCPVISAIWLRSKRTSLDLVGGSIRKQWRTLECQSRRTLHAAHDLRWIKYNCRHYRLRGYALARLCASRGAPRRRLDSYVGITLCNNYYRWSPWWFLFFKFWLVHFNHRKFRQTGQVCKYHVIIIVQ